MLRSTTLTLMLFAVLIFSGCTPRPATPSPTKGSEFPYMYEEQPRSILILPPMNESPDAEAKDYYMTTIEMPIAQMGYYVFPIEMVGDIMKQEGVYDTELLYSLPLDKFYEYFGADAVMFTRIVYWDLTYLVLNSYLTVTIESEIKSAKTSQQLWKYRGSVKVDLSGSNGGDASLGGLLVQALATAVNTAAADYVDYAHVANSRMLYTLPFGPYHPLFLQDQGFRVVSQQPKSDSTQKQYAPK